jgi:very-short-patch-repair endonuclease
LDGGIHKATRAEDRERQIHLEAFDNKVVRFRNDEVENSIESVLDAITRTMDQISNNSSE